MGTEFQFCKMKRLGWMDGGEGCTTMQRCLMPLNCVFYNGKFCYMCILSQLKIYIYIFLKTAHAVEPLSL